MSILKRLLAKEEQSDTSLETPSNQSVSTSQSIEGSKKLDLSIKRKMFWNNDVKGMELCPQCSKPLEVKYQTYMFAVKEGRDLTPYLTGNDCGHFCLECPTVVLDYERFKKFVIAVTHQTHVSFLVAGIVNQDAIPEDKRNVPLGEDDNPIPLVEFILPPPSGIRNKLPDTRVKRKRWKLKPKY